MKKVMFVVVSLLLVGSCFAQLQSGPSNTVGYVKIDVAAGTQSVPAFKEFGLPFQFWDVPANNIPTYGVESRFPSDIVGAQTNGGTALSADRITRQENGLFAYRTGAGVWSGALETGAVNMDPGRAYWYINKSGVARSLVLAGQVNNGNYGVVAVPPPVAAGGTNSTPYSWRDARDVPMAQLGLITDGFLGGTAITSDRVQDQSGGQFAWYRTSDNTWQGTLTVVRPGRAYWIQNKHVGHPFNYGYEADGSPISLPNSGDMQDIQVISTGAKTTVKTVGAAN